MKKSTTPTFLLELPLFVDQRQAKRLRAALERLSQRAKEGQVLPRSVGIPGARARLPKSLVSHQQGLVYRRGRLAALE